jgi:hypothetical protein
MNSTQAENFWTHGVKRSLDVILDLRLPGMGVLNNEWDYLVQV